MTEPSFIHIMLVIYSTSGVNLALLQSSIRELQCLEYFKSVFLEMQN